MGRPETQSDALTRLAAFAANLEVDAVPPAVLGKAKSCLLYGLAVGIAADQARQPKIAARVSKARSSEAEATRLLDGKRSSVEDAAFVNATLFHSRCQEDAHPAGHVGTVVLPAALAAAEGFHASGTELLTAIVAGYEVALRIGRDHATDSSARGFRSTSTYGVFGAAAAAAKLRRLDRERTAHALALAANVAGGLRAFVEGGSDDFPYHAGFAARNGLLVAALAAAGAEGPFTALEGRAGFFAAFGAPSGEYSRRITADLGHEFELAGVTFKPYPICQFHRAIVAGLLYLRPMAEGKEATAIEIRMNPVEADFWGVRFAGPFHSFSQAFMSAPYCAAVAWERGNVELRDMNRFGDHEMEAMAARVTVVADPERSPYQPFLSVSLTDGRCLIFDGGPEAYQLQWDSAVSMAHELNAESGVPPTVGEELITAVAALEQSDDLRALLAAARSCITASDAEAQARSGFGNAGRGERKLHWRKGDGGSRSVRGTTSEAKGGRP